MLTIMVALIAGAGVGIAGAFGLEFLYQTYHFSSDIERELELPVLGLISDYPRTADPSSRSPSASRPRPWLFQAT